MTMGERIKYLRERADMTQEELGSRLGVQKSAIRKYEKGEVENIKRSAIKTMADIFGVSPVWLMGFDDAGKEENTLADQIGIQYGKRAMDILKICKSLNESGITQAINILEDLTEVSRYQKNPVVQMRSMPVFDSPAAAGNPMYAESTYEYMEFPVSDLPAGADFGVRISGESMDPTIEDGSIVWVEKTAHLYDGQVGVFMLGDSAVCKRINIKNERVVALRSDNPEYPDIEGADLEEMKVVGKVLNI